MLVEATTIKKERIVIKLKDISVVKEKTPEYPKFEKHWSVFVRGGWSWTFDETEGQKIYNTYKEYHR